MEDWIARAINSANNHIQKHAAVAKDALRCNRWIASSALQKAIRRGELAIAQRAAFALRRDDRAAAWRRLIAIAFEDIGPQASSVLRHSSHRSSVGGPTKGSWRKFAEDMADTVAARLPAPSEDKWFPRGIEGEVGAIAHLNRLLDGGRIRRAVLVDPWFDADALRRFALRLRSLDLTVTIVTSLTPINPYMGTELRFTTHPAEKLESTLRQLQPFLSPRLALINLADGNRQAFHDRYLLLYPHEGPPKVFLLSNSLNNAAGDWPFAISLLAADAGREVRRYIEGLCDGQDIARGKGLTITLRWPPHA